jgi:hypothetical protein
MYDAFTDVAGKELAAFARDDAVNYSCVAATSSSAPTRRRQRQFVRDVSDCEESCRPRKDIE